MSRPDKPTVAAAHRRTLRSTTIDEHGPGTVLRDFEMLLDFIAGTTPRATAGYQLLPRQMLPKLNARLVRPVQLGLQQPQHKSFPHVHGLYLLARAGGLVTVEPQGGVWRVIVDPEVRRSWETLNPTERYFTLLETWSLRGHPQIIGESGRPRLDEHLLNWRAFFARIPADGWAIAGGEEARQSLRFIPGLHGVALFELFGLIDLRRGQPLPGKDWQIDRIFRTPLGDALLQVLYEAMASFDQRKREMFEGSWLVPFGTWQPVLQPYFPAWRRNLSIPPWEFRAGTYVFKVSWGRQVWRRVAAPAGLSLDRLAEAILDAFDFAHDHLYRFSYRNRFGLWEEIDHPELDLWGEEKLRTSQVRVGDLSLAVGQGMTYLFDFGDQWEFDVLLEQVDPHDPARRQAELIGQHGRAPQQYRD